MHNDMISRLTPGDQEPRPRPAERHAQHKAARTTSQGGPLRQEEELLKKAAAQHSLGPDPGPADRPGPGGGARRPRHLGGVAGSAFAPEGSMDRSMVWTVLARLTGQTISGSTWAVDAQAWAVAQGVSDGTNPGGAVSREELVTMLYRFAGSPAKGDPGGL